MVHFVSGSRFDRDTDTISEYEIELSEEQFKSVVQKCVDLAGIKYGKLELLGMEVERIFGIRSPFRDKDKTFVCSELVGVVLRVCGIETGIDLELAGPKLLEQQIATLPQAKKIK